MTDAGVLVHDDAALVKLGAALHSDITDLLAEVSRLLRARWPDYADYLDDNIAEIMETAIVFVQRLVETARRALAHVPAAPLETDAALRVAFEEIGRAECAQRRDLTQLLSAYRVGAQAAWRHVSATALRLQLPQSVFAALGEAVFVFVDQLASASARGYVEQQSLRRAERERLRCELAELVLSNRCDTSAICAAAHRAGWPLPSEAALVLADGSDDVARTLIEKLDHRCLPVRKHDMFGAVVPGPLEGNRRGEMVAALRGANAVVGRSVALPAFPASVRLPVLALDLQRRGVLDGDPVFVGDHLDTLIVHGDGGVLNTLRTQVLAPLDELSPQTRARLIETLGSWLHHMGDRGAVAEELFIHPQTVRYRMGQLRERFGVQLDSPRMRARLLLALEWGNQP